MAENMKIDTEPLVSPRKRYRIFVAFGVSFLLVGLAFRLLLSVSPSVPSDLSHVPQPPVSGDSSSNATIASENDAEPSKCDIFTGEWVPDPSGPAYTNVTCRLIEAPQNCMRNGRPDSHYLYWRWKPSNCDLPRLNPRRFLAAVRDRSWAFIGDSIMRNHVQSLLCILSQVEEVVETYHDKEYKSRTWRFPSHNFTLSVIWAPLLVRAKIYEDSEGVASSDIQLFLDQLDTKWTEQYRNLDYVVIAGGKWFLKTTIFHENNKITGCHYCQGKNNLTELGYDYGYRKALRHVLNFIAESEHKPLVLLRTTTPDHFEHGEWFSGGFCNRTMPYREGDAALKDVDAIMRTVELEEFQKIQESSGTRNGDNIRLLDTTMMSWYRPDGHPGPYRHMNPFAGKKNGADVQNDCLHWCLPGPIDYWNDLIMAMMIDRDQYR